jgi:hypothetical protein
VTAIAALTDVLIAQAHEASDGLWDPKLKGYLVVISAIALFCGSVYLLLWTNMGSSLGFLVAGAAVTGIVLMLSTLWITGQFPNGKLGRLPKWNVHEMIQVPVGADAVQATQQSRVGLVSDVASGSVAEASQADAGQIKADLDAHIAGETADPDEKLFNSADDFRAVRTWKVGGERKMPIWWSKKGEYAAVEVCTLTVKPATYDEINNPPFVRDCDPAQPQQLIVLHHDLGAQRLPSAITMAASAVLLAGFLYGLYIVELRQREQAAAAAAPESGVPATT